MLCVQCAASLQEPPPSSLRMCTTSWDIHARMHSPGEKRGKSWRSTGLIQIGHNWLLVCDLIVLAASFPEQTRMTQIFQHLNVLGVNRWKLGAITCHLFPLCLAFQCVTCCTGLSSRVLRRNHFLEHLAIEPET